MKALIPFCLLAGFLSAQSLTWIDLSGPWRIIEADDPRFAQPDFDDSAWKPVPLPGHRFIRGARSNGGHEYYFWLRRTVSLPAGLETRKLALTLGTLTENYQVYWNGALVASAGNFTVVESRIARPRTFDLPPSASSLGTISIRGWVHAATGQYITCAVYEPAQEVGGDFYWTRVEPDGSLLVAVGDVSGKGLKAAMLVSAAVGALRNERSSEPGAVLAALNGSLEGHTGGGFVTIH